MVDSEGKDADRRVWGSGSYARIAELVAPMGRDVVELAGVGPGMRVLDVAAGTGNAAIPAASAGAAVTAVDLTPSLLAIGRARAEAAAVHVDWVEGDAEDLPYPAESFDVVLSTIGAMFDPDQVRTAAELVRVCRRGGTLALANWTPHGYGGAFFGLLGRYVPPPPGGTGPTTSPPTAWGDPDHVSGLFDGSVDELTFLRRSLTLAFGGTPEELAEIYRTCFGPVLAVRALLAVDPARRDAFDQELVDLLRSEDDAPRDGSGEGRYQVEYLVVTAVRRA